MSEDRRTQKSLIAGERRAGDPAQIRAHLARSGRVCIRVHGSSMLPWVRPGDVVLVRSAPMNAVRCGDVVLMARDSRFFVHRLIAKGAGSSASGYLVKGDAHPEPDGVVAEEELLGRVVRIYRGGGRIDLDSPRQLALGLLLSQLSLRSDLWYPVARVVARVAFPLRRFLLTLRSTRAPLR